MDRMCKCSGVCRISPIGDEGIRDGVIVIIVRCSHTRIEEDLSVLDWSDRFNLHVYLISHNVLKRVGFWIPSDVEIA